MNGSIYINTVRASELNLKAIREAAQDFAAQAAREQEMEAAALGLTRTELILRRIRERAYSQAPS